MRKFVMMAAWAIGVNAVAQSGTASLDSTRVEMLQEVVVKGVRAQKDAPFAVANIGKKELQDFSKTGKEMPFLLNRTPGVIAWSENGLGTGTTYMRVRGAGGSRINVTLDGVPLNSPEDQCVFWANMNSYAAFLGSAQIQRGVGTSTNGDGAFGGTVALSMAAPMLRPSAEVTASYGSYNTMNAGVNFSSGLLWKHFIIDGAYHETTTDGYIHGTDGRSGSFYGGLTWLDDNLQIRYKNIGNFETTGQAWNGVTAGDNDMSLMDGTFGIATGIKTYEDMYKAGLGRYNTLYETLSYDDNGAFLRDANGNYVTQRYKLADGSYWKHTTDNFWQDHNLLTVAWNIDDRWNTTATLHYTHGYGFYSEFRPNNKLKKFGLANFTDSQGNKVKKSDFVRKKGLSQDAYGLVWNINYKTDRWNIVGGLSWQRFDGNHFGYLTYVGNPELSEQLLADGFYKYYDSDAVKTDLSHYLKATYNVTEALSVFADAQYRYVNYKTNGVNDKFYENADGTYSNQLLNVDKQYDFFNPKGGLSFHKGNHQAYASVAFSHREPERNNFTDNGSYPAPRAERLMDYEVGYNYTAPTWQVAINGYYMDYAYQFVQTGAVSDIGEALTTNIKDSYRMGVEVAAGWQLCDWLSIEGNAALSQNKIKNFDEVVEDWDNGSQTIHYDNSTLAFSPSFIGNGFITFRKNSLQATWHTAGVSRQYLDNTKCKERSLPSYCVSDINLSYTWKPKQVLREAVFGLHFNNVFNKRYAASGWVYSAISESSGHTNDNRYYQIGFIPMAGFTVMGNVTLRF